MSRVALPRPGWLWGAALLTALTCGARATALELVVEARGPLDASALDATAGDEAPSRRLLSLAGARARLLDPVRGRAVHLDLEARRLVEVDLPRREVRERAWGGWEAARAEARRQALDAWRRGRAAALAREDQVAVQALDEQLRRAGLRADGAVELSLRRDGPTRTARLTVDGAPLTVTLERWVLRENQAARPLAELWVAPALGLADDPLRPFRALLGAEAAARLATLPGPVLEATLQPPTGAPWTLRTVAVRQAPGTPERALEPPGWGRRQAGE